MIRRPPRSTRAGTLFPYTTLFRSCRRATGSPVAVLVGYKVEQVAYPKEEPRSFASSTGRDRPFCPHCGSRIGFTDARLVGRIYFHIGVLDEPERFQPTCHALEAERLPWLHIDDDLPRFPGRSEEHTPELQSLMRISNAVFCLKNK